MIRASERKLSRVGHFTSGRNENYVGGILECLRHGFVGLETLDGDLPEKPTRRRRLSLLIGQEVSAPNII